MPLIYLGIQIAVAIIYTFALGIMFVIEQVKGGIELTQDEVTNMLTRIITENQHFVLLATGLVGSLVFFLFWNKEKGNLPPKTAKFTPLNAVLVLMLGLASNIIIGTVIEITRLDEFFSSYAQIEEIIMSGTFAVRLFGVGILAPIAEELCFRGLMYNRLKGGKMPVIWAMILSSLAFGIIHFNILQSMYAFAFGMVIVFVYEKYKSIFAPILIHIAVNTFSVLLMEVTITPIAETVMFAASILFAVCYAVIAITSRKRAEEV
jgi:membrane protease YdiL (CAAX protease family)